jgi:acyl-homoserine lactone acylase PvdQ
MSGAGTTVKQTTAKLGPSLRFVADTASWDNSFLTLVTGQSGHLLSFDYKDHWDAYYEGRGLPFPFIPAKTAGPLTLAP